MCNAEQIYAIANVDLAHDSAILQNPGSAGSALVPHGFAPVISLSSWKKPRLRGLLIDQLTGTL